MNKEVRVQITREMRDNKIISMIRKYPYTKYSGLDGVVIDRAHGRTITRRCFFVMISRLTMQDSQEGNHAKSQYS